MLLMMLNMLLG